MGVLRRHGSDRTNGQLADLEARRPVNRFGGLPSETVSCRPTVLAVGVVLGDQPNTSVDTDQRLGEARHYDVSRRWILVDTTGNAARRRRPSTVDFVTATLRPKYELLNELLAAIELESYAYLLIVDDDVILPYGFVDAFLDLQTALDFAIAQPTRTAGSSIDHPIVAQHPGLVARQTWFVEQGPVVSFHRSVLGDVVPFDLRSPMGWGYEYVWSAVVARRGLQMGVIDAVAVDHSMRPVLTNYSLAEASDQCARLLGELAHRPVEECMRVVRAIRTMP